MFATHCYRQGTWAFEYYNRRRRGPDLSWTTFFLGGRKKGIQRIYNGIYEGYLPKTGGGTPKDNICVVFGLSVSLGESRQSFTGPLTFFQQSLSIILSIY